MKYPLRFLARLATLCSLTSFATARIMAATTAPAPIMTEPRSTLETGSFATEIPTTWHHVKGNWAVVDGAVRGTEIPADNHQAVIRRALRFTDAIITFSFRLDDARQISVSFNDAREHVCRLIINAHGFIVQKDDHDHAGPDKPVVFARIPMVISTGDWHTATIELNGPEMVAQIDAPTHVGFGAHELLNQPKANFGFTVAGGSAEFRDVTVRDAASRADWPDTKNRLAPSATVKRPLPGQPARAGNAKPLER